MLSFLKLLLASVRVGRLLWQASELLPLKRSWEESRTESESYVSWRTLTFQNPIYSYSGKNQVSTKMSLMWQLLCNCSSHAEMTSGRKLECASRWVCPGQRLHGLSRPWGAAERSKEQQSEKLTEVTDSATRNGRISQLGKEKRCERPSDPRGNRREYWAPFWEQSLAKPAVLRVIVSVMQLISNEAEITEIPNFGPKLGPKGESN